MSKLIEALECLSILDEGGLAKEAVMDWNNAKARIAELERENAALKAKLREAVEGLREVLANHTFGGVKATMFCSGCIDDYDTAEGALKKLEATDDQK
jgi:hypothetical protein